MNSQYLKAMAERRAEFELIEELDELTLPGRFDDVLQSLNMSRFQLVSSYKSFISRIGQALQF